MAFHANPHVDDIGKQHVNDWCLRQKVDAFAAASDHLMTEVRAGTFSRKAPPSIPARRPRMDDVAYLDGDYARCGSFTNAEWSQ